MVWHVSGTSLWWSSFTWRTAHTARVSLTPDVVINLINHRKKAQPVWTASRHVFAQVWSHILVVLQGCGVLTVTHCVSPAALKKVIAEDNDIQKRLDEDFIILNLMVGYIRHHCFKGAFHWMCMQVSKSFSKNNVKLWELIGFYSLYCKLGVYLVYLICITKLATISLKL